MSTEVANPAAEPLASLPVLPLKNSVLFPYLFLPLSAGRPGSVAAVEAALASEDKAILVVAQRNDAAEQPTADDLYTVGTRAVVKKMARSDGGVELLGDVSAEFHHRHARGGQLIFGDQTLHELRCCVTPPDEFLGVVGRDSDDPPDDHHR